MSILGAALLVEDNALIATHLRRVLEQCGFAPVHVGRTLLAACELVREQRVSFALVVANDHAGDAGELGTLLALAETPFGFVSDYHDGRDLPAQFRDRPFLVKPYTIEELAALLEALGLPDQAGRVSASKRSR